MSNNFRGVEGFIYVRDWLSVCFVRIPRPQTYEFKTERHQESSVRITTRTNFVILSLSFTKRLQLYVQGYDCFNTTGIVHQEATVGIVALLL